MDTRLIDLAIRLQSSGLIRHSLVMVLKVTIILLIARLLLLAASGASAAAKHLGTTVALCGILLLPILAVALPVWNLAVLPATVAASDVPQPDRAIGSTGDDQENPSTLRSALKVARVVGVVPEERLTAMSQILKTARQSWQGLILLGVAAVSLILLGRMLLGICGVWIVARRSESVTDEATLRELVVAVDHLRLRREVRLLRSPAISVPVVWGFFRPILLLPLSSTEWSSERLRVVLMHELAHVTRCDGVTLLLSRAAVAIFWFHPLMWSLERASRRECERACDDLVLAAGTKASEYAEHLLSIARALPHFDPFRSVTLAMSRRSQLEGRLLSILHPHIPRSSFSRRAVLFSAALALLLIVPLAAVRVVASPSGVSKPSGTSIDVTPALEKVSDARDTFLARLEGLSGKDHWVSEPESGFDWYSRGYELYRKDRYVDAISAFKQSIAHNHRVADSAYNIACSFSLMNDENNALEWLGQAIDKGFDNYEHIADDSDLDPIRSSPRFQALIGRLAASDGEPSVHGRMKERMNERVQARVQEGVQESIRGVVGDVVGGVAGGVMDGIAGGMKQNIRERKRGSGDRLADALTEYRDLRGRNESDGGAWFSVGYDLLRLRALDESIDAFQQAIRHGSKTSTSMYNLACAYSLRGDTASGMAWLEKSVQQGFDSIDKLDNDPDIARLRSDSRFNQIRQNADDLSLSGSRDKTWWGADDWSSRIPRFRAMTAKYPSAGRSWFNLGYALLQTDENSSAAADAFRRALDLGYRPPTSAYNIACSYARADRNDEAMQWLGKARSLGFDLNNYIDGDDDLDNLRSDPRFRELRQQIRAGKGKGD
jgi:beta-lactamase regulating signal transducer with metallopeptidase domain/tetratricopeptide (TPR) repeat protein